MHVVAKNPTTLVAQATLIHPNYEINPRLRIDNNTNQLSTSDLVPASDSLGYLLQKGEVRLKPDTEVILAKEMLLEAYEPRLIGVTIADYAPFKAPIKMRITQIGTKGVTADVELVNPDMKWPSVGTIVSYATSPTDMYPIIYNMLENSTFDGKSS